jgi:hypothetical protein
MPQDHEPPYALLAHRVSEIESDAREMRQDVRALTGAVTDLARNVAVLAEKVGATTPKPPAPPAAAAAVGAGSGAGVVALWEALQRVLGLG